jgi:hypothetical protein
VLPGEQIESLIWFAPTLQDKAKIFLGAIYWAKNWPFRHERGCLSSALIFLTCVAHSSGCDHSAAVADWLAYIVTELTDLDRGRVPPRFVPNRRRSGRPASRRIAITDVILAPRYATAAKVAAAMVTASTLQDKARILLEGIYEAKNLPPGVIEHERYRLVIVLLVLRDFVQSGGCDPTTGVADWLAHIVEELEDPNCGRGASMFAPTAPEWRNPPKSSEIWRGRALIASGVDLLIDSGVPPEDIKKKLRAGKFGDLRVFVDDQHQRSAETLSEMLSDRKVLSNRAIGWREQLRKVKVQNNPQAVTIWNGRHHKLAADGHNKEALAYEFF